MGIVQETEIRQYNQIVYAQHRIRNRKWDVENHLEFQD